jgi:hypothetical protein
VVERRRAAWRGGALLFALAALLLLGLVTKSRATFSMSEGFHPVVSIFLLLELMASRPETLRVRRD